MVGEADAPRAIALSWNLLYVPVILVTVAIAVVVENYNENGVSAASVAGEVLAAALAAQG